MMSLPTVRCSVQDIKNAARAFVDRCERCVHGWDGRCFYRSPTPTNGDMLLAFAGAASERPTSRNYAAQIALKLSLQGWIDQTSSWCSTWERLDEPCPHFEEVSNAEDEAASDTSEQVAES